jgi:DNA polymerase-4
VAKVAAALLASVDPSPGVRLLGVSASNLVERPATQLALEEGGGRRTWDRVGPAVDAVRRRFGEKSVGPATLLEGDALRLRRLGDQQWGPGG